MKYLGLAIDETRVVGVRAYKEEGLTIVDGTYEWRRVSSVEDDLCHFFDHFELYTEEVGVVLKKDNRSKIVPVPSMERYDVLNTLYWDMDIPKEPFDDEIMDFLCYDELETPLAYAVMLLRADVKEMIDGVTCSDGNLKVVAHWPSPLVHSRHMPHSWIMGLEENGRLELFLWSKLACLARRTIPVLEDVQTYTESVEQTLASLLEEARTYDSQLELEGLAVWGSSSPLWEELYTQYGYIEEPPLHMVGDAKDGFDMQDVLWESALGLAMRGIEKGEQ